VGTKPSRRDGGSAWPDTGAGAHSRRTGDRGLCGFDGLVCTAAARRICPLAGGPVREFGLRRPGAGSMGSDYRGPWKETFGCAANINWRCGRRPRAAFSFARESSRGLPPATNTLPALALDPDGNLLVPTNRGLARQTSSGWEIVAPSRADHQ